MNPAGIVKWLTAFLKAEWVTSVDSCALLLTYIFVTIIQEPTSGSSASENPVVSDILLKTLAMSCLPIFWAILKV